jgi:hypothetical protein
MFFYYEAYENEFDEERKEWVSFNPEEFPTNIILPRRSQFHGYDVVTFSMGTSPECSPLSCNHLAAEIRTNPHCLLESLADAKKSLEAGRFAHSEPGPFRIFSVYTIDSGHWNDSI